MIIGITDPMRDESQFDQYATWITRTFAECDILRLSPSLRNAGELARCHGLLVTGGGDVHPKRYGRGDAIAIAKEVNEERDEFELEIIKDALDGGLPALGICRGAQIFNVALGGTLIPDVEAAGYRSHRRGNAEERLHPVIVERGTLLGMVTGTERGEINTSHHQAVAAPGAGLCVAARSDDGIVEALEWQDPAEHPFLLLIQWHPERLRSASSPFARNILRFFVQEVQRRELRDTTTTKNSNEPYLRKEAP